MAEYVLTDAFVSIDAVDLSDHVRSVSMPYAADEVEVTAMSDTAHTFLGGLKDWTISVEFNQDHAAGSVDDTLWDIVGTGVAIEIRPTSAVVSATNPKWTATGLITQYDPLTGGIGEAAVSPVTIRPNATGGTLVRAIA